MSCPYNVNVKGCKQNEKVCHKCGWNPEVEKARKERLENNPPVPGKGP